MPHRNSGEPLLVASLAELEAKRVVVVSGADRPIAVFRHEDEVFAVDNRCPHLGFPLHKGSVRDGLLTCHWHEARFDLCSGCTFDLWADDVPAFEVEIREGMVYVARQPRNQPDRGQLWRRLLQGLEHDVSLVQGKALLGLRKFGVDWTEILREVALFGARNHDQWGEGMTLLAVAGNLLPLLSRETAYHVVFRACRQVGSDCADAPARRQREPLAGAQYPPDQLGRWMRTWVRARHREASERVLLTAIEQTELLPALPELVFTAASDRVYAQTGHVLDGWNKALELLAVIGQEHAASILPLVVPPTVKARGSEEDAHWHHPHELIEPLRAAESRLPTVLAEGASPARGDTGDLLPVLLGDDPLAILAAIEGQLRSGAPPGNLSGEIALAAADRLARFADSNEVGDWFNPRHTFIFANAVHQAVKRSPNAPGVVRALYHAALAVYMDRFLNVPPARVPDDPQTLNALPSSADELRRALLAALDRQSNVAEASLIVRRYLRVGHPVTGLIDTLALASTREDLDFHALQVLDAAVQQCREWGDGPQTEQILLGVVRQLAAFCPTPRAGYRIAVTALRLERGDKMYEDT